MRQRRRRVRELEKASDAILKDAVEFYRSNFLGSTEDLVDRALAEMSLVEMREFLLGMTGWAGAYFLSIAEQRGITIEKVLDDLLETLRRESAA